MSVMRKPWGFALVSVLVAGACIGTACGSSSPNGATKPGGSNATDAAGDGGSFVLGVGDSGPTQLVIQPSNPTLAVNAAGVTLQFTALLGTTSTPALWSIGAAGVGSIDSNGLFTASGLIGGLVPVTATAAGQTATTNLTIDLTIVENPGNVNAGLQGSLQAGESPDGGADPAFAWLYPYDTTIFPRDVPAPTMQFGGTGFDAAMVQVTFPGLSYTGFYGASTPGRVQFSAVAWNAITGSAGGSASVQVQVTKSSAGVVSGPITSWTIAQGSLAGSIYYNSYNSAVANNTGAVLKLRPGEAAPTVVIPTNVDGECHVCHAVQRERDDHGGGERARERRVRRQRTADRRRLQSHVERRADHHGAQSHVGFRGFLPRRHQVPPLRRGPLDRRRRLGPRRPRARQPDHRRPERAVQSEDRRTVIPRPASTTGASVVAR